MSAQKIVSLTKVLRKLDRPPAGPNWARFVFDNPQRTAKTILAFAKGQPPFTYRPGYNGIKDRIELGIDLETALRVASARGAPAGRQQNKELVDAFFQYDFIRRYSSSNPIEFETEYFRVSRDVLIPVSPLTIIREHDVFVPIFVCGWSANPLTQTQRRLLITIYEDAFLSLTDYQASPAEILFFPTQDVAGVRVRCPEVWRRGDYEVLSKSALNECLEIFILAREIARGVILDEIADLKRKSQEERDSPEEKPSRPNLFEKE